VTGALARDAASKQPVSSTGWLDYVTMTALAVDVLPPKRIGRMFGVVSAGSGLGGMVFMNIVGRLVTSFSYTPVFVLMACLHPIALLFGESQGRAIVACTNDRTDAVTARAAAFGVPARMIGKTTNAAFLIQRNGVPLIRTSTPELARIWRSAFGLLLGGDSIEDVIRGVGEEAPEVMAH